MLTDEQKRIRKTGITSTDAVMKVRRHKDDAFEDFECDSLCIMADDGREYFFLRMNNTGKLIVKAPIFCNHAGADRAMTLTIRPTVANEIHIERNIINEH